MAKQGLAGPQVAGALVNQRHLGSAETVGAIGGRVEAGEDNPLVDEPAVLPCRDVVARMAPAREPVARA